MVFDDKILTIQKAYQDKILAIPGVSGITVEQKQVKNKPTDEWAITVFVEKKRDKSQIPIHELIPETLEGFKTDVVEKKYCIDATYRGGDFVESGNVGGGTLGCFATTRDTHKPVLLTNQHVFFEEPADNTVGTEVGPKVCSFCSPCCSKIIAKTLRASTNNMDAAIAELLPGVQWTAEIEGIGTITNHHEVLPAETPADNSSTYLVQKRGTITGLTQGRVRPTRFTGPLYKADGSSIRVPRVDDLLVVFPTAGFSRFSESGDSGSAVLNMLREVVGIHVAGAHDGSGLTVPIQRILDGLNIDIATSTTPGQVNTVPGNPSIIAADRAISGGAIVVTPINDGRLHMLTLERKRLEKYKKGQMIIQIFKKHREEVRLLINENYHVAMTWHRNRGPALLNLTIQFIENRDKPFPKIINGRPFSACIANLAAVFKRFGSTELLKDLAKSEKMLAHLDQTNYEAFFAKHISSTLAL